MKLLIKVIPNAKQSEVVEDYDDLLGNRQLRIRVNKPAQDGKANQEVIEILSKYLKVKKREIVIISGLTSRNKIIEVDC